jgi:5'-nucleotidase
VIGRPVRFAVLVPILLVAVACGASDEADAPPTTRSGSNTTATAAGPSTTAADPGSTTGPTTTGPTTTVPTTTVPTTGAVVEPLQILVTNDDGIEAPGIDALVTGLATIDDVEITIVSPAENQSGTSMNLTDGELASAPAATASGVEAIAVTGFPADSVRWALENLDIDVDLVVSGSNSGQNIGDFSTLSGTVGAARYAAQQGIPAVAVSQGFVVEGDIVFADSVEAAVDWIVANRGDYEAGVVSLTSINAPTCPDGVRGVVEVPLGAFEGRNPGEVDCASTLEAPIDDVDAFTNGFTAITELPIRV